MSLMMANTFNTGLILLENCMLLTLTNGLFTLKRTRSILYISFLGLAASNCLALYFFGSNIAIKLIINAALSIAWILFCYDTSIIKSLFAISFWIAFLTISDNTFLSVLSAVMGKSSSELMSNANSYYFICFCTKIAEMLAVVIIHTLIKHNSTQTSLTFSDWLRVIIFPLATLLVSFFLLRIYYFAPEMSWELALSSGIILLVDVASVFLLAYLERQQTAVRDNIILRQSMKSELDNVEAWRKAYDGQRKQTHDFQNQLIVIHGLVAQKAPTGEVLQYIERLQNVEVPSTMIVKTHRTAVDIILNQKYAIAENRKIRFSTQLDDLSEFPLADDELITVLANLIDNAIEACQRIEDVSARFITLKMKMEESAAFLYIENLTAAPVQIKNNCIITSKKNSTEHGYGLQNITSVLDRKGAIYFMDYNDATHIFSFSAQILRR